MSEHWTPESGSDEPTPPVAPAGDAAGATGAIPLPPTAAVPTVGPPTMPTGVPGQLPPAPTTGVPGQIPSFGWGVGGPTGDPYAGGRTGAPYAGGWSAGGGSMPPGGWPAPGFASAGMPYSPASPTKKHTGLLTTVAVVGVAVALLAGAGLGHAVWHQNITASATAPSSGGVTVPSGGAAGASPFSSGSGATGNTSTGAGAPSNISAIAAKVSPALVDINTNLSYQNEQAAGTGMVLTSNGEILTNNHVIDGATSISVTDVGNGKTYKANVVGYDRTRDVAVVQLVGASGLRTITASKAAPAVGQAVVGVGNAGGTGGTPSNAGGSVTALNQAITASDSNGGNAESLTGLIEVNAAIEPGDSGGSLVNTSGQVLGMDTAASTGSGYQVSGTQGYAIPIGSALSLAKQIEAGHSSATIHIGATGFLGVSVQAASAGIGTGSGSGSGFGGTFGSGAGSGTTTSGAVVVGTLAGSPSANAGLTQGDVITGLNGKTITSATDLTNFLGAYHPGDTVQLTWTDTSGQTHTAGVTLASGPPA